MGLFFKVCGIFKRFTATVSFNIMADLIDNV